VAENIWSGHFTIQLMTVMPNIPKAGPRGRGQGQFFYAGFGPFQVVEGIFVRIRIG
jgi:hypothetical protein